ncbi:origin recognition complex subunit 4 [Tribolium madens]|uniref:origin recognition complex subunit 4 n=1 Tax=Tribolium madens TaxID=41895 RepID=UPI001CF765B9|nr:origin recognition complex subunit 4 [Tribolium madens]
MKNLSDKNIINLRKFLKNNILNNTDFMGQENERQQVYDLLHRTITSGESNSALLIGPRASGKTTLVNNVLGDLQRFFSSDAVLVKLHGLIHTDDRIALKSITAQMNLENAVDGKVFGSFADNLTFLLACLKSGERGVSKSIIFIIEEFDLFCSHHNQTLLYNLFDVSQSAQTPICVLGITCRLDVIELLEKRVKSRFSHRQIFLFLGNDNDNHLDQRLERLQKFLLISNHQSLDITPAFRKQWNSSVNTLLQNRNFKSLMQRLLDLDLSERSLKNILLLVVSELNDHNNKLSYDTFLKQVELFERDETVQVLQDLSVLELCLIITMKHHCEIYDNQPMNFEMVFNRYLKFANANSNIQTVERPVIMKAFEQIQNLELISALTTGNSGVQKEYQLFKLLVLPHQISEAVKKITGLPTEVTQYANSSLV